MKTIQLLFTAVLLLVLGCTGCGPDTPAPPPPPPPPPPPTVEFPDFNQDSAYAYIAKQVDFGPRVPETPEHKACSEWIFKKLESFGWQAQFQDAVINGPDNNPLPLRNIIGSINPENTERVLLCAHWDTRAMADQDTARTTEPALGADDGGSGVGILLEIARVIGEKNIDLGIDIVFFDVEDQGESNSPRPAEQTWCLGSQFWSRNMHPMAAKPAFGILLDMVGFSHARFPKEGVSRKRAPAVLDGVWKQAHTLGYNDLFVNTPVNDIVDDHVFVNDLAKIPTIDIINLSTNQNSNRLFGYYWHTHRDNMDIIGKHTLKAVGRTLLRSLYSHEKGQLY